VTLETSGTTKDDDQAASWTEAKAIETRTGPGREKDIMREREPETENLSERETSGTTKDDDQYNMELNQQIMRIERDMSMWPPWKLQEQPKMTTNTTLS
jgi:hypothetical protein